MTGWISPIDRAGSRERFDRKKSKRKEVGSMAERFAATDGNLARDLNAAYFFDEQNAAEQIPAWQPEEPVIETPVVEEPVVQDAQPAVRPMSFLGKVAVIALFILFGFTLLYMITDANRVYAARQKYEDTRDKLEEEKKKTAVLRDKAETVLSMSELYEDAVQRYGMREAQPGEYVTIGPLVEAYTVQTIQEERKPTEIRIHWFGK